MLKPTVFALCAMATLFVGIPCIMFGLMAISGNFADVSRRENFVFGLQYFWIASLIFGATVASYWWIRGWSFPSRFGVRTLLLIVTVASLVFGAIAAILFNLADQNRSSISIVPTGLSHAHIVTRLLSRVPLGHGNLPEV
jgi:hypothetical protein